MDQKNRFNIPNPDQQMPPIRRSEHPIEKKNVDPAIIKFLCEKSPKNEQLLNMADFKLEFICVGELTAFIKIETAFRGSKEKIDLKLSGSDAKKFVELIDFTKLWEN